MSPLSIPITAWSMGVVNGILSCTLSFVEKRRARGLQLYKIDKGDATFIVALFIVIAGIIYIHNGGFNLYVSYGGIDAAQHWKTGMDVYTTHSIVKDMYYDKLFNGMLYSIFMSFIPLDYSSKIVVLGDYLDLAVAALMFYGVVCEYTKRTFSRIIAFIMTFMFILGYQFSAIFEGFVYLGMGVTFISLIVFLIHFYENDLIEKNVSIISISLSLLGLILCYSLFVPITYLAVLFIILRKKKIQGNLWTFSTVKTCLYVFVVPCVIGFFYSFLGIFGDGLTVSSQIASEGGIHKDFFSNFIFVIILAIVGSYRLIKQNKEYFLTFLLLGNTLFILFLFIGVLEGKVSSYYYYKLYYEQWLLCFLLAVIAFGLADSQDVQITQVSILGVWVLILFNGVFNTGAWIQSKNDVVDPETKSVALSDIYAYNYSGINQAVYNMDKQDLYHEAFQLMNESESVIPIAAYWHDYYWYQAFTNLRYETVYYSAAWNEWKVFFTDIEEMNPQYILVLKDCDLYNNNNTEYFDNENRVYENDIGYIIEYNKAQIKQYMKEQGME